MALKFLNKKGWHTGSLRNIENVWKAEQKHDAEQKKLEELRKQIQEEREKSEFRLLQEQAGLIPRQERLDFLYDSGLAVGKGSSDGFKALESYPKQPEADAPPSSSNQQSSAPGALFEDKPQSANDAWRKLHSDPLLLIRQREQEALARIKNNPVQMANIRKSVQDNKKHKEKGENKKEHKSHSHKHPKRAKHSSSTAQSSEDDDGGNREETKKTNHHLSSKKKIDKRPSNARSESDDERRKRSYDKYSSSKSRRSEKDADGNNQVRRRTSQHYDDKRRDKYASNSRDELEREERKRNHGNEPHPTQITETPKESLETALQKQRRTVPRLSEEEKAARLREMQMDAVLHEEQRWKRLKKASENDAREGSQGSSLGGQNFLHAAQKSVYGAEKGGSSTIEESVRRRKYYSQGQAESSQGNAFRR